MPLFYLDTSALGKLVLNEPESKALQLFVGESDLVSSELALAELPRAVRRAAAMSRGLAAQRLLVHASALLDAVALLPMEREVLVTAGALPTAALRTLDAVHVASALAFASLDAFITYDDRQGAAARLSGLRTIAPGR